MTTVTKETAASNVNNPTPILFVGEPRICPQVAYVLDIQDYATVAKLTKRNIEQYRDYQIYVCARKRKRRKYVKFWGGG